MKFSKYNIIVKDDNGQRYLFNTFSGSCFSVDAEEAAAIEGKDISLLNEDTIEQFSMSGVLIKDDLDEDSIFSYYHGFQKYDKRHLSTTLFLTWACNLSCIYCFQGLDKSSVRMDKEHADIYLKFLKNNAEQNRISSMSIVLFGGEPLMNIDIGFYILDDITEYCKKKKISFSCSIVTNGTLLNNKILDRLRSYNCDMIQITLDGVREIHDTRRIYSSGKGSFDEIMQNLRLLNERNDIPTVIRVNIDKTNLEKTYELLDYIGKDGLGLTNCHVDFGIVKGDTTACSSYAGHCLVDNEIGDVLYGLWSYAEKQGFHYDIRPSRKFLYCGLYKDNSYSITPTCEVYKCWEHAGQPEHLMGKLDKNGNLTETTNALFKWMAVDPLKNSDCKNCAYLPNCGGGCRVISYNETGTYHSKGCFGVRSTLEKEILKYVENETAKAKKADRA